jgi:hypothetical protein
MSNVEKLLDDARKIFLTGVDEETLRENEAEIQSWEQDIRANEAFAEWQKQDISKSIAERAKETYVECAITLATNRELKEPDRWNLYAKQDAVLYIITLIASDAKEVIASIEMEIKNKLSRVS